jgi:plastocyanin
MRRRILLPIIAVFALTLGTVSAGAAGSGADPAAPERTTPENRVLILGADSFEANVLIQSTFRFSPDRIYVTSGERLRFVDEDEGQDPHTITVVPRSQLPAAFTDLFACGLCNEALDAHFGTTPPTTKVNQGRSGLSDPGDSLLLLPDDAVGAAVHAPAGTALSYLCAIHPWMQGRIIVT